MCTEKALFYLHTTKAVIALHFIHLLYKFLAKIIIYYIILPYITFI